MTAAEQPTYRVLRCINELRNLGVVMTGDDDDTDPRAREAAATAALMNALPTIAELWDAVVGSPLDEDRPITDIVSELAHLTALRYGPTFGE